MSRREFTARVKRDALARSAMRCENPACGALITVGKYAFDHDLADGLGGEPTLENCVVLCLVCHAEKTTKHDVPTIAKMKRQRDNHQGTAMAPAKEIKSPGFQHTSSKRRQHPMPLPKRANPFYVEVDQ